MNDELVTLVAQTGNAHLKTISENEKSKMTTIAKMIHQYCGDRCNIDWLVGPANVSARAAIMSAIVGKTQPRAKSGINILTKLCNTLFDVDGDCMAIRSTNLVVTIRRLVGIPA